MLDKRNAGMQINPSSGCVRHDQQIADDSQFHTSFAVLDLLEMDNYFKLFSL